MPIIKKPFSLAPLNDNPAVLSAGTAASQLSVAGGFSHKGGFPTIKFSIAPQPALLEMGSLKLVGQLLIKKANNDILIAQNDAAVYANGGDNTGVNGRGGTIEETDANMVNQTAINLPNWGGVKNCIDKVVIQSKKSLIELSSVNNYGQYVGLTEAYSNNSDDYTQVPLIKSLSGGNHAEYTNRRINTTATSGDTNAHSLANTNDRMIGQFFSIPIQIDLMNQNDLFLDDDYLGGMLITLHLASDNAVFSNKWGRTNGATTIAANDMSGLNYVLKNIRLEGRYLVPDQNDMANIPPVMNLESRLNLINDIHSSVNANAYTPQLQSVKSVVNVFLDNDQTNTFNKNSNNFRMPPGMDGYQQARNGLRFPYNYETNNKPNTQSVVENVNGAAVVGASDEKNLFFPALAYGTAEVRKQFEASILNGGSPYHTVAGLELTNEALKADIQDALPVGADTALNNNLAADCVGIGADYTLGIGMTQQFVNQDYNLTLKSKVNTGSALVSNIRNGSAAANPLLEQSFIRYSSQFDTQSLVKVI